ADGTSDVHVRRCLRRLAGVAERTGCAVVLLRHLTKGGPKKALYRGGGNIGIVGGARAGLLVARDPDDVDLRVLACTKSNLSAPRASLRFTLEPAGNGACRVAWHGPCPWKADDLLGARERPEEAAALTEACQVLTELLRDGPRPADDCRLHA